MIERFVIVPSSNNLWYLSSFCSSQKYFANFAKFLANCSLLIESNVSLNVFSLKLFELSSK